MPHEITEDDMRWVRSLARQMKHTRLCRSDLDDLEGDGMVALVRVAARYDPDNTAGATFRTYAYERVCGAMIDGYRVWHGSRQKSRPQLVSLDRIYEDVERYDQTVAHKWQTALAIEDNHDDFELDLNLHARLGRSDDRIVAMLLAVEDLDKQDVAQVFAVTPSAVSHRIRRIRERLA